MENMEIRAEEPLERAARGMRGLYGELLNAARTPPQIPPPMPDCHRIFHLVIRTGT